MNAKGSEIAKAMQTLLGFKKCPANEVTNVKVMNLY